MNRLLTLARRAAADPKVSEILSLPSEKALQLISHTWFKEEFDQFLETEGDRPADSFEFTPTWREMPEIVVGIIKGLMDSDDSVTEDSEFQAYRQQRIKELGSTLKRTDRDDFDAWLELAEEVQPLSEIHDYILMTVPLSYTRYAAIEAGRRFVQENILDSPDDVFFLYRGRILII